MATTPTPTPTVISNIKFGKITINKIYFGYININRIYFGNTIVFDKNSEDTGNFKYILYKFSKDLETLYNTKELAVQSAILKGSTKYRDIDTGEFLETFEEGRNLELVSVKMPVLTTSNEDGTKTNILTVNEDVTLRGVGDVKDELNLLTGEVTERVGEIVLDGSENWKAMTTANGTYRYATTDKTVNVLSPSSDSKLVNALSNRLPITTSSSSWRNTVGICNNKNSGWVVYEGTHNDLTNFKEWLSRNPITVQYELATPVIKTIDLTVVDQDNQPTQLGTFENVTHVSLEADNLIPEVEMEVATHIS